MNITDAAYATVHDYPGGSEALAPRMGMSAAVLRNKVNPNNTTHHLTLAEAQRMVALTGDKRLLHAFAMDCGDLVLEGICQQGASDMAVLEMIALLFSRNGGFAQVIHDSLADGSVSAAEIRSIERAGYAVRQKVMGVIGRLKGMQEPGDE